MKLNYCYFIDVTDGQHFEFSDTNDIIDNIKKIDRDALCSVYIAHREGFCLTVVLKRRKGKFEVCVENIEGIQNENLNNKKILKDCEYINSILKDLTL